jgi:hypothetical protein
MRDLSVDALSDRNGRELLPDGKPGRAQMRCTLYPAPRNKQSERSFELRSLGEFGAKSLLLPHKSLQLIGRQCHPQS